MCSKIKYKFNFINREPSNNTLMQIILKWFLIITTVVFVILLVLLILLFIIFPLLFKYSLSLQRLFIFWNINVPENPRFQTPQDYGFEDVTNFYITSTVDLGKEDIISIGAWWLPNEMYINSNKSMDEILARAEYPVVIYNHGIMATRIVLFEYVFRILRRKFHVVAIDYRDFGDSTQYTLTEEGVVADVVHTYNLLRKKTPSNASIYIWGHSLGGGISAHAVKSIKDHLGETPTGFIIESSFSSLEDEVYEFPPSKIFKWLPWFDWCVVDALHENGFIFDTTTNLLDIDCPVMILHAEDDPLIPYKLGKKNFEEASRKRGREQGKIIFHSFSAARKHGHVGCLDDEETPIYIDEFKMYCEEWKIRRKLKGRLEISSSKHDD